MTILESTKKILICPQCKSKDPFVYDENRSILTCSKCGKSVPVKNGIPRFASDSNYAKSFGMQWKIYGSVQVDSIAGNSISHDRFYATTNWSPNCNQGKLILDVGCGGGRFSEVALETGAEVVAFDYTSAVDVAKDNIKSRIDKISFFQASVYEMPFDCIFDAVYCMGVLQHTPDPKKSLKCMVDVLKPGGELIVDVYLKYKPESFFNQVVYTLDPQRWFWKPIIKRLPFGFVREFIVWYVRSFLLLDNKLISFFRKNSFLYSMVLYFRQWQPIVIMNHCFQFPFLKKEQWYQWAEMNTIDIYTPKYTYNQSPETMRCWAEELGLKEIDLFVKPGCGDGTALVLKAKK